MTIWNQSLVLYSLSLSLSLSHSPSLSQTPYDLTLSFCVPRMSSLSSHCHADVEKDNVCPTERFECFVGSDPSLEVAFQTVTAGLLSPASGPQKVCTESFEFLTTIRNTKSVDVRDPRHGIAWGAHTYGARERESVERECVETERDRERERGDSERRQRERERDRERERERESFLCMCVLCVLCVCCVYAYVYLCDCLPALFLLPALFMGMHLHVCKICYQFSD